jgi:hypothetical protein
MHRIGGGQQRLFALPGQPQGRGPGHHRLAHPAFAAEKKKSELGAFFQECLHTSRDVCHGKFPIFGYQPLLHCRQ